MREKGGVVNTSIVKAAAWGILMSQERLRLAEFGGPATLTTAWAKLLLKRMNYTQRRGTTKAKVSVPKFNQAKELFLQEVIDVVAMEDIPIDLIFNWDQTGLYFVPVSFWTMTSKGSKHVEIQGLTDKRQITGVFCRTLLGEFFCLHS
uniref:DDE-1 domain-containing protein n=1 Tax=Amphimedon queenslandica TaxID=400682 RepID=A0A1X7SG32_AMPQE